MQQVIFGGDSATLDDTVDRYNTLSSNADGWNTVEGFRNLQPISTNGTIKNLRVKLAVAPGAGKSYDFTLMLNGNPTGLTLSIADAATSGNNATEIAVVAGDEVTIRCAPTNTPAVTYAAWTSVFVGDTANESLILGTNSALTLSKTSTVYTAVMGGNQVTSTDEDNHRQVCPTAGTIKNLYVVLHTDPGTAPDAYRITLRLNGATVGESLIVTIVANNTAGNDTVHNLVVAAGDILTLMMEPIDTPSETVRMRWGMTFVADTDDESIVLGGTSDSPHNTATEYNYLITRTGGNWTATENTRYQLGQTCVLKKLHMLLSASPGSGKKYTFTARIAGLSSNVVVEIADTDTIGNSGALEDTVSDDDYVGLMVVPTSTPDVANAYWGLVSYIAVPVAVTTRGWMSK